VRISPTAKRFAGGKGSPALPSMDDDWIVERITDEGLVVVNARTRHRDLLGFDHIHGFTADSPRGSHYGFLTLTVQVNFGGNDL
jgi:hypothetical protein